MNTTDIETPETANEPTPEWYSAQVQELCDIRGFLYSLIKEDSGGDESLPDMVKRMFSELQAENERLKQFARVVIEQECWSIFPQDGGDLQELAENLGLIVPCIATEEDIDDDSDFDVGDTFYKFSDMLKGIEP